MIRSRGCVVGQWRTVASELLEGILSGGGVVEVDLLARAWVAGGEHVEGGGGRVGEVDDGRAGAEHAAYEMRGSGGVDAGDDAGRHPDGYAGQEAADLEVQVSGEDGAYVAAPHHPAQGGDVSQDDIGDVGDRGEVKGRMVQDEDGSVANRSGQLVREAGELVLVEEAVGLARDQAVDGDDPEVAQEADRRAQLRVGIEQPAAVAPVGIAMPVE